MDARFLKVVEIEQYFMTKTQQNSHNSVKRPVLSTLCQEKKKHHNQKDGFKGTPKLDLYWMLQSGTCTVSTEWKSELCL